jgi:hypothetical protein
MGNREGSNRFPHPSGERIAAVYLIMLAILAFYASNPTLVSSSMLRFASSRWERTHCNRFAKQQVHEWLRELQEATRSLGGLSEQFVDRAPENGAINRLAISSRSGGIDGRAPLTYVYSNSGHRRLSATSKRARIVRSG